MVLETRLGWCGPFAVMAIDDWEEKADCMHHLASTAQSQTSNTNFFDEANKASKVLSPLALTPSKHLVAPDVLKHRPPAFRLSFEEG
jgi:hypothetical protein